MNNLYVKTILYAYPHLRSVIRQIDRAVEMQALASVDDSLPCITQCEKILDNTFQKVMLISLKRLVDGFIEELTQEEVTLLEYKYFKTKDKEFFEGFDYKSRSYFRKQNNLVEKIGKEFVRRGITDERFKEEFLQVDFLRDLHKRVIELEAKSHKNKGKKRDD